MAVGKDTSNLSLPGPPPTTSSTSEQVLSGAKNISSALARSSQWKPQPGPLPLSPSGTPASCLLSLFPDCLPDSEVRIHWAAASAVLEAPRHCISSACGLWRRTTKMSWRQALLLSSLLAMVLLCSKYGRAEEWAVSATS